MGGGGWLASLGQITQVSRASLPQLLPTHWECIFTRAEQPLSFWSSFYMGIHSGQQIRIGQAGSEVRFESARWPELANRSTHGFSRHFWKNLQICHLPGVRPSFFHKNDALFLKITVFTEISRCSPKLVVFR